MCCVITSHNRSYINDTNASHITPHHSPIKPKHLVIILALHLLAFLNAIYNFVNLKIFIIMLYINLDTKAHLCYFHSLCCRCGETLPSRKEEDRSSHARRAASTLIVTGAEILCLLCISKANYSVLMSLSLVPVLRYINPLHTPLPILILLSHVHLFSPCACVLSTP
jgi:hypothetical protein